MSLVRSQLLIHRGGDEGLSRLFRRHLPLQCQTTAPGGIRADVAIRADHVQAQDFEPLEGAAYRPLTATAQFHDHGLPLDLGWIADFVRVHLNSPRISPREKPESEPFVPGSEVSHEMVVR